MRQNILIEEKAQGAIEYLLLLGAAVLVVVIVLVAITNMLQQGTARGTQGTADYNSQLNDINKLKKY